MFNFQKYKRFYVYFVCLEIAVHYHNNLAHISVFFLVYIVLYDNNSLSDCEYSIHP